MIPINWKTINCPIKLAITIAVVCEVAVTVYRALAVGRSAIEPP